MFSISSVLGRSHRPAHRLTPPPAQRKPAHRLRRQRSADEHIYFSVRSFAANGAHHILQYAFVDDRGNIVLSAFGTGPNPVVIVGREPPDDMAITPLEPEALNPLIERICGGASLVAFGRVLQSGLLPAECLSSARTVDCAWRRYLRISRQRHGAFDRDAPSTLNDALAAAGLAPLETTDAALRALAIRDLWAWMDRVELRSGVSLS